MIGMGADMSGPLHDWKQQYDARRGLGFVVSSAEFIKLINLLEDADAIISDLLKGGVECTDQDKRQIISRKKVGP